MSAQPLKVSCASCSTNYHVPGYLVRGKVVNFRCKRCRGIIEVDGRALKPISTPPPAPDSMGDSSMRLSISDGVLFERPSSEPPPRISSTPPPPMFPSEVPARRSSDSFTPRRVQVDPHLASQATFSTAPPTAVAVSESPASAALRSDRPPPADAGKRTKRVVGVSAVVVALGLTAWGLAARELSAPAVPVVATPAVEPVSARMQPGDFRGVTADPSKPLPTPAEPTPKPSLEAPAKPAAAARPKAPPPLGPQMAAPAALPAAAPVLATSEPTAKGEGDVPVKAGGQAAHEIASGETTEATAPAEPSEREFDTTSARAAIEEAGQRAAGCRTIDAPAGAARLAITFAPTGRVTSAVIDSGPFAGTPAGACVVSKFRTVQVPPFDGESVTVHKTIAF